MDWVIGIVLALIVIAAFWMLFRTMETEDDKKCPWCGVKYRYSIYDDVWVCRWCWHSYHVGVMSSIPVSLKTAREALDKAETVAEYFGHSEAASAYDEWRVRIEDAYEEGE